MSDETDRDAKFMAPIMAAMRQRPETDREIVDRAMREAGAGGLWPGRILVVQAQEDGHFNLTPKATDLVPQYVVRLKFIAGMDVDGEIVMRPVCGYEQRRIAHQQQLEGQRLQAPSPPMVEARPKAAPSKSPRQPPALKASLQKKGAAAAKKKRRPVGDR